jgi:hypothetical protein
MAEKLFKFYAGDTVCWNSQANGWWAEKTGVVMALVGAGEWPHKVADQMNLRDRKFDGPGPRNHISYLVRVPGRGTYWPRTHHLRLVNDLDPTNKTTPRQLG